MSDRRSRSTGIIDPCDRRLNRRRLSLVTGGAALAAGLGRTAVAQQATPTGDPFRVAFVYVSPVGDLG